MLSPSRHVLHSGRFLTFQYLALVQHCGVTTIHGDRENVRSSIARLSKQFIRNNHRKNLLLIRRVFDEYNTVDPATNIAVINDVLKVCVKFKYHEWGCFLWDDIQSVSRSKSRCRSASSPNTIAYHLLLQCLTKARCVRIDRCIQTLEWKRECNFSISRSIESEYHRNITTLISKCDGNLNELQRIHSLIEGDGGNVSVQTALISQYGRCSDGLSRAETVFNSTESTLQSAATLNAMMTGYIHCGQHGDALSLYDDHHDLHDDRSHVLALTACAKTRDAVMGERVHRNVGNLEDIYIVTALVNLYGVIGRPHDALRIFRGSEKGSHSMTAPAVNAMLKALVDNELHCDAMTLYQRHRALSNERSHVLALKSCSKSADWRTGRQIAGKLRNGENVRIKNAMIDLYAKCGDVESARKTYDSIGDDDRDSVSLNAMMNGYLLCGLAAEALSIYDAALRMDDGSHLLALRSCMMADDGERGRSIHSVLAEDGDESIQLKGPLIEFYGHFGDIEMVDTVFGSIDCVDSVSVGAMMKALCANDRHEGALGMYHEREHEAYLLKVFQSPVIFAEGVPTFFSVCIRFGL